MSGGKDVEQRLLGATGLATSAIGFGCGAIGGLMVKGEPDEQRQAIARAIDAGMSYFDTAPGYRDGRSEENLGRVLRELRADVIVGTKVRLDVLEPTAILRAVRLSIETSLRRLRRDRVHLLQLHNAIGSRGAELDITLGPIMDALHEVRDAGLCEHVGFTALGDSEGARRVIVSGRVQTAQVYFNALNPSAGWVGRVHQDDHDFGGLIDHAEISGVGAICIRPLAAGAIAAQAHRHAYAGNPRGAGLAGTPYDTDLERAQALRSLAAALALEGPVELALRFALSKPGISTVLIGFSDVTQLENAIRFAQRGALTQDAVERVLALAQSHVQ
jgi:L-galactose dehydrogenase/L-glyceraldehyde 3-phosphate reductase